MKPPIPYFGAKQRIAHQIVALFPNHLHYVEPYAGSLSVLLAKPLSKIETVNDLDADLVTFWRVLRDQPDDLMAMCAMSPHSRAELKHAQSIPADVSDLERARRIWVQLTQGRSGTRYTTGWRFYLDAGATSTPMAAYLAGYVRRMPPAAARTADVQLEARPALDVIADYGQSDATLLYVDPPYLGGTRRGSRYLHEMTATREHELLAEALTSCRAKVVLSGYPSQLYDSLYSGWSKTLMAATSQQGDASNEVGRTEVCWTNFEDEHLFSAVTA